MTGDGAETAPESESGGTGLPALSRILAAPPSGAGEGRRIGRSRDGRPVEAFRFGSGPVRVSLLAGCHADEPVGPALLRRLVTLLDRLPADAPPLRRAEWWVVPHVNPDGEAANAGWQGGDPEAYDLAGYLRQVEREPPGDDVEFGFPRGADDDGCRPETRAVYDWWRTADGPFRLHASLHGMAVGRGPWFLLEAGWADRTGRLQDRCRRRARQLGYRVHDEDRHGEKGFRRISRGFSTRPDSRAMREHFRARDDPETAARFRPSSMEAVRGLGGDALTVVPEMPLFVVADGAEHPAGAPGPVGPGWKRRWRGRLESWAAALRSGSADADTVRGQARAHGLRPMPVRDQMELQWVLVREAFAAASP